jgi:hypothetical protein
MIQIAITAAAFEAIADTLPLGIARPAVQRGLAVAAGPSEDLDSLSEEEKDRRRRLLFNQRAGPIRAQEGSDILNVWPMEEMDGGDGAHSNPEQGF